MRKLAVLALVALAVGALWGRWIFTRALPVVDGTVKVPGLGSRVEVIRDRAGIPHIFAERDEDAYVALGFVTAQDRLFQMELSRRAGQGRLSEALGPGFVKTDRLFRTVDLFRPGARMLAEARPEARAAFAAYARGVNASVTTLGSRLPPEFALLGLEFEPVEEDDFVGVLGFMAWGLNMSWTFDPLYQQLEDRLGPERAAELIPGAHGGRPSVYPDDVPRRVSLFELSPAENDLLSSLPGLRASNNWVVGPGRSATGRPLLANDPHLGHGIPGIWYQAHLVTPTQDVIGVTVPGVPFVVIGHNRHVAWGSTNVMLDGADFFVETVRPETGEVKHRGVWKKLETRTETIRVRFGRDIALTVHQTPHGPLVTDVLEEQRVERERPLRAADRSPRETRALAYQWNYHAALDANDIDGFYALNRARNWDEFRYALGHFGTTAQNMAYADVEGHIGMQTSGRIPRLAGRADGNAFRDGASGDEDWDGFVPFEDNPSVFDPARGWLASANNPTVGEGSYYISSQWEPVDRYSRIAEH